MRGNRNLTRMSESLNKQIVATSPSRKNMAGSETDLGIYTSQVKPKLPAVSYVLDNSAVGSVTRYIIGDPTGMVAAKDGGTLVNPTTVQGKAALVVPHKNFFYGVSVKYTQINYETSSDSTQFASSFEHRLTNIAGIINSTEISIAEAKSNVQQNPLLLTLRGEYDLDINSAYVIEVLANEKVLLVCTPSLYIA